MLPPRVEGRGNTNALASWSWERRIGCIPRTKFLIHCPLAASHSFIDLSLDPVAMNCPEIFARSAGWK